MKNALISVSIDILHRNNFYGTRSLISLSSLFRNFVSNPRSRAISWKYRLVLSHNVVKSNIIGHPKTTYLDDICCFYGEFNIPAGFVADGRVEKFIRPDRSTAPSVVARLSSVRHVVPCAARHCARNNARPRRLCAALCPIDSYALTYFMSSSALFPASRH